ncbi:NAD(P)/FAD-dependent oxidoreductase [Paroceanicella profunda]|uniref:NAD(P)/FAD-dependent oxidoreductase n=1 Tax=Paroceanicella profunda TaxID=2579971 RepID=A0A5B8FZ27_9RHOB|nr:NAD(P)/FAD-dependent oxidoreductase [Paroceanicella profunda]QDL92670.1 NAD(P)/FAD-dependent oxidoreductase [Paroceanicella profunda]
MPGTPDYIIVGSGINALVCAALLGKAGRRVLVLEREGEIGGCMKTAEITAPGFVHDVMATTFVLFVTSPAYAALGKDLARHGLEFAGSATPTGVLRPDGSSLTFRTDRAANIAAFNAAAAGDGDTYRTQVAATEADAGLLFGLLGGGLWTRATLRLLAREALKRGPRGLASVLGAAMTPMRSWLESSYRSELTRALWAPWGLHAGLGPEAAFSGQMGRIIAFALEAAGAPIVKGGAANLTAAFRRLIEEQGGEIRTGADVAEIRVSARAGGVNSGTARARGVMLAGGRELRAEIGVIASVTPDQLYGRLLPGGAERERAEYRYGKGNFQLHYALKTPPKWRTEGLSEVALLHLTPGLDGVSKASNEAERGLLPAVPTICVGQPTALDPSRAPAGQATLWLQLPEAPRQVKGDAAGEIDTPADGTWTEALREAYADRVQAILESHIEGFADSVIARKAYSPADLEALNVNLVGGDPYGGACTIDQFFLWRPFKGSVNHETVVRNLWHIGASTHPGPGLGGGSGYLLGRRLA